MAVVAPKEANTSVPVTCWAYFDHMNVQLCCITDQRVCAQIATACNSHNASPVS